MSTEEQKLIEFFKRARSRPVAVILDSNLPLSVIFNEPEKKIADKIIKIINENRNGIYLGIKLQSIDVEIREVVSHKIKSLFSIIKASLKQIEQKVNEGANIHDVVREERQKLISNKHYCGFYNYVETKGFGLLILAESEEHRIRFVREITEIPDRIIRVCNDLLKRFYTVRNKDDVVKFISKEKKTFRKLTKATTKIGSNDRGHLVSCHLYAHLNEKNTLFVTMDEPIINIRDKIISIFENERLRILHPTEFINFEKKNRL